MRLLYGRHYHGRYAAIADLIPLGSSVVDLCCGPGVLFARHLKQKSVRYTGLDVNRGFITRLRRGGGYGEVWDIRSERPLPRADYAVMQASLYQFLPDASGVVDRMLQAARRQVIIAEPIHNLASSDNFLLRLAGQWLTDPGTGGEPHRFTEATLDHLFSGYQSRLDRSMLIPGGREKVYVLKA